MRIMSLAAAAILTVTLASPAQAKSTTTLMRERADYWLTQAPLAALNKTQDQPTHGTTLDQRLNWTTDGCSVPGGTKTTVYDVWFEDMCDRHDFGYRNYGNASSSNLSLNPTKAQKEKIDKQFKHDMDAFCNKPPKQFRYTKTGCKAHAAIFYKAVTKYGDKAFFRKKN